MNHHACLICNSGHIRIFVYIFIKQFPYRGGLVGTRISRSRAASYGPPCHGELNHFCLMQLPPNWCYPHWQPVDTRVFFQPIKVERVVAVLKFTRSAPFPVCLDLQFCGTHGAPPECFRARGCATVYHPPMVNSLGVRCFRCVCWRNVIVAVLFLRCNHVLRLRRATDGTF
jgi:hypothetical protein